MQIAMPVGVLAVLLCSSVRLCLGWGQERQAVTLHLDLAVVLLLCALCVPWGI